MGFRWILITLIIVNLITVKCELFSSTIHLIQLFNTEVELANQLEIYLNDEYKRLNQVKEYLDVIKDEMRQAEGKEENYFVNPINSFLFIKHLTIEWYPIEEILPIDLIKSINDNLLFPSFNDYIGCAVGIMRLQDTYSLKTKQLANGEISNNFKSKRLTARDCYDLGRVAYTNDDFYHTLMWMQEALDHLNDEIGKESVNEFDILDHLAFATSEEGNIEHALAITEKMISIAPDHARTKANKLYYDDLIKNRTLNNQQPKDNLVKRGTYEKLCQDTNIKLYPSRASKLLCRYRHNNHPYLLWRPIKEEQLFDEPPIFLYHDIISDKDIHQIKSLSMPRLQRAAVRNADSASSVPADYRISKSTWFEDKDSPAVARLSRLISAITNLTMETAEDLQIANYGIAGHYEPHLDFATKREERAFSNVESGNRIATWLTYMSDVEQGGATVFPDVGARIVPIKGSASFWYNLYASGEGDYRTLHAGCPVLIGNKWIGNKWIHERGQEFRRRCSVDPMA